jgi:hypothetical protein
MHCSKNDPHQIQFEKDLVLFIVKELVPLSFVEAPFLRTLIFKQNPHFFFPSRHQLMNHILLKLAKKTKTNLIFEVLEACDTYTLSFDLWMSKGRVDTFVLIVHILNHNWGLGHVTIDLFEITKTSDAMAIQVNEVLAAYGLNVKILAYVKDEGSNISIMTSVVTSIVSCELLKVDNAMSKCCQYATNDTKVFIGLTLISIEKCQSIL